MLRKLCAFLICFVMLVSLSACGSASKTNDANSNNSEFNNGQFDVNQIVFDCDMFTLTCENISIQGIEFSCDNKSKEEIKISLRIALDGVVASLWSDANETKIAAGTSKNFLMHGSIETTEHALMSVDGTAFIDSGNISFELCDLELGGAPNAEELPSGDVYYESDHLIVEYLGADAQGVDFKVINKREQSITFGADSFTINGDDKDYAITVTTIPGHSQGIYSIDILSYNENYFANQLSSFEGILRTRIDGQGEVDRFPVSYKSTSVEVAPQPVISLGYEEAARLFEKEFESFETLIDDVSDTLEYYNNTDFVTIEDIRKYESMWQDMATRADAIQTKLLEKSPPTEYEKAWNDFSDCLGKIADAFAKGTNLDPNNDGRYTGDEIKALLSEIVDEFSEYAYEAVDLTEELTAISKTVSASTTTSNDSQASVSTSTVTSDDSQGRTCTECGNNAPRTYTNPFTGEIEPYCETHYEEIIDIMSMMESDVGNSAQSKRTCEECTREGTHRYSSFTGQTEYYCTQHYEELMDLLEMLGLG